MILTEIADVLFDL